LGTAAGTAVADGVDDPQFIDVIIQIHADVDRCFTLPTFHLATAIHHRNSVGFVENPLGVFEVEHKMVGFDLHVYWDDFYGLIVGHGTSFQTLHGPVVFEPVALLLMRHGTCKSQIVVKIFKICDKVSGYFGLCTISTV
jgi:hypothetical protein